MNPTNNNDDVQDPEREGTYTYRYPHPAVTTDCCIFTFVSGELAILLIRRGLEPYRGVWALPGGFVRINETAEECARRELFEETGYGAERITQFHTYSEVNRDPRERVITIAYYAIVKWGNVVGGDDAVEAGWFSLNNLPHLAFDHQRIIGDALKVMKRDIYFEPLGYDLLPAEFSMSDLQRVYENIMQTAFDRRNFYNKMRNSGMVIEVEDEPASRFGKMNDGSHSSPVASVDDDLDFEIVNSHTPSEPTSMSADAQIRKSPMESDRLHYDCCAEDNNRYNTLGDCDDDKGSKSMNECKSPKIAQRIISRLMTLETQDEFDDEEPKTKPARRKNVKYRFNVSKFIDLFKKNDEPFKL